MRSIFTLLAIVAISTHAKAQNSFSKVYYNDQTAGVYVHSLEKGYANSFVLCGYTSPLQGYIQAVDASGNLQWQKTIEVDYNIYPRAAFKNVAISPDSSYIFSGYVFNTVTTKHDAFIVKTDLNGDTLWTKGLELLDENFLCAQRVSINPDSTLAVLLTPIEGTTIAIATLSADGQLLSSGKYTFPFEVFAESFVKLSDGSYSIIGRSVEKNAWLLRIASDGNVITANTYTGYLFKDITLHTNENAFYLVGQHIASYGIACLKTDLNGQVSWSLTDDMNNSSSVVNSEQIKIQPYDSTHLVALFGGESSSYLSILDTNGFASDQAAPYMKAVDLVTYPDGSLAVAGNGPIFGIRADIAMDPQIGLIRTDSLFNAADCMEKAYPNWQTELPVPESLNVTDGIALLQENYPPFDFLPAPTQVFDGCVSTLGGIAEQFQVRISAFPTASNGLLTIESEEQEPVRFSVHDETGKIVYNQLLSFGQTAVDVSQLGSGVYFCHYQTSDLRLSTQKIMLIND